MQELRCINQSTSKSEAMSSSESVLTQTAVVHCSLDHWVNNNSGLTPTYQASATLDSNLWQVFRDLAQGIVIEYDWSDVAISGNEFFKHHRPTWDLRRQSQQLSHLIQHRKHHGQTGSKSKPAQMRLSI